VYSPKFARAFAYAERLHRGQRRKGTDKPYIGHLISVTSIVIAYGGDEEMAIAVLLHDAVEDQGGRKRLREIEKKFGKRVARIVDGCTDSYEEPKPPWLERKRSYIARVVGEETDTQLVSAADKLSNARHSAGCARGWRSCLRALSGQEGRHAVVLPRAGDRIP
jgi:(p)ppGpp synthase/HD superfamily hydrolase